jgi:hypothetical protein
MHMKPRDILLAALLAASATPSLATPQFRDANDLWVVPDELGWGINVFHQGNTLFASIFVYGPDGAPRWYTASSLQGDGGSATRGSLYTGAVYESTGPGIGVAFNPALVTRRDVGSMGMEVKTGPSGERYADVALSINGVAFSKRMVPFSFVPPGLTGSYTGYATSPGGPRDEVTMNVSLGGGSFGMSMMTAARGSCTFSGQQELYGSLFNVRGTFSCSSTGASGSFTLTDVDVTRDGFTAKVAMNGMSWTELAAQRTSSSIRGDGYTTDLWLAPNESGWGLNIIEQGDTLFGTLFVYDSSGRARWYSASNLTYEQCAPPDAASDCWGRYRGALAESTGPYFGTSFNPSAVQRRQVGTMTIDFFGNNTAYVTYTVDGVGVTRKELRRFAFRANSLAGAYAGHILALNGNSDRGMQVGAMTMDISESGDTVTIAMHGTRGTCSMTGKRFLYGRQAVILGPYDCGGPALGQMSVSDINVTYAGFTAGVDFGTQPGVNVFYPIGRMEAVHTAPH